MLTSFTNLIRDSYSGLSKEVWILAFLTLINRTGSMVLPFLTLYLTVELKFTLTQAGFAVTCYGVGSVAGSYIGGWLTDRFGFYPTMFWSLLIGGLAFFPLINITELVPFCVAVMIVSTIVDSFRPASMASIGSYSKPENHNRSLSLIRLAINLGFAGGAAATGLIATKFGYDWLFAIDGFTCISAAFLLRLLLKEKKVVKMEEEKKEESLTESPSAYSDTNFLFFIGAKCIAAIAFFQLFSAFPAYMKQELGFSEAEYGWLMFANGLIIALLEMPAVFILEKRYKRMPLIIAGYTLFAFGFFALTVQGYWMASLIVFITAISVGEIIGFPFSNAFALSRSTEDRRGEFMGLYSMAFSVAFIIGPTLGLYIAEHYSFSTLWYFSAALCSIAVVAFIFIKGRLELEEELESKRESKLHSIAE